MLYFNSSRKTYNLKALITFYKIFNEEKLNFSKKNLKFNFLFKIFFLENFSVFLKSSLYQNFKKNSINFKKTNLVLILFFIKTFLRQFKRILHIMYLLGYNNVGIFFLFLSKNFFFFENLYAIIFKKYFATFDKLKRLFCFKKRYLYRFKFWFPLKKFLKIFKVKLLIL